MSGLQISWAERALAVTQPPACFMGEWTDSVRQSLTYQVLRRADGDGYSHLNLAGTVVKLRVYDVPNGFLIDVADEGEPKQEWALRALKEIAGSLDPPRAFNKQEQDRIAGAKHALEDVIDGLERTDW